MFTTNTALLLYVVVKIHNLTKPHKGHKRSNKITLIIANTIFIDANSS